MKNAAFPRFLNLYLRLAILVLSATAGIAVLAAGARMALAADLKGDVIISGDMLTVGDIFTGLKPERASYVLGPAPQPGKTMTLNAQTLLRVAVALDLPWKPISSADKITIRRAATIIDANTIKQTVTGALEAKGLSGHYDLVFSNTAPEMVLPENQVGTVVVKSSRFDAQKDWFEVTLVAPSLEHPMAETSFSGQIQRYARIPVLKSSLRNGDVIGASDLTWIDIRTQDIQPRMIIKAENIINMTPRRIADAGKPLMDSDMERPQIVDRGNLVTLVYNSGPIRLTTMGKALQGGGQGDIVQAVNTSSNRNIQGLISGKNEITVTQ